MERKAEKKEKTECEGCEVKKKRAAERRRRRKWWR